MGIEKKETASLSEGERSIRPRFVGSARQYFRIWIVNLLFTLLTFGIYSAWAKVRKKRYLYGCTSLDGDTFDYFASPRAILNGRLVAVGVFVGYAFIGELFPVSRAVFWMVGIALLPWLVVRTLSFNARNSAWRGLRFDFSARAREAASVYLGRGVLVLLTLGLAFPWFMARQRSFVVSKHCLGTEGFTCTLPARTFFGIYFRAGLIASGFAIPALALLSYIAAQQAIEPATKWASFAIGIIPTYAGYTVAHAYVQARTGNLMWNCTVASGVRFSSTLSASRLARLYIGNVVACACSIGLLIPWAVVRTLRYRFESLSVIVIDHKVFQANAALTPVGATGQEIGDFFNLDLGL